MGILHQPSLGQRATLKARHLVGRSRACDLRLRDDTVSGEHATLWWDGSGWWVRDLGSRNGTVVGGALLQPGEARPVKPGAELVFGKGTSWVLESGGAPGAMARNLGDGRVMEARDGLLALPDEGTPDVTLFPRSDGSWLAELPTGTRVVVDLDLIEVLGERWQLHLPEPLEATRDASVGALRLPDVRAEFRVSLDEEHVELHLTNGAARVHLPPRVHHYTLLLMARARMQERHLPEPERGWIDRTHLAGMQRQDKRWLNVQLFRARRQLAKHGVVDVDKLVQRRGHRVRLGIAEVAEAPAGP